MLGNYFKNLYLLVKYIRDTNVKDFKKDYYIDLVKSQLSKFGILLLAYDCIWIQNKKPGDRFLDLARDTDLLKSLERPIPRKKFSQEALTLAAQASLKRVAKTLTHPIKLDVSLVAKTKRNLTGLKIWYWQ